MRTVCHSSFRPLLNKDRQREQKVRRRKETDRKRNKEREEDGDEEDRRPAQGWEGGKRGKGK